MIEAMRTPEARAWLAQRKRMRDAGTPIYRINRELGGSIPGHTVRVSDDKLQRDFIWAVRCLLGGESRSAIAAEEGSISAQRVGQAITRVVGMLPDLDIVPQKYHHLVEQLRTASL